MRSPNLLHASALLALLTFGIGCSTTVEIQVHEAAQLPVPKFERVAVPSLESPTAPGMGAVLASKIRSEIAAQNVYRLVEADGTQLKALEEALVGSQSRLASEESRITPGKLESPQVFVFGTIGTYDKKTWSQQRTAYQQVKIGEEPVWGVDQFGNPVQTGTQPKYESRPYQVTDTHHTATLSVSFKVVDIATNRIVAEDPYSETRSSVAKGKEVPPDSTGDPNVDVLAGILSAVGDSGEVLTAEQMLQQMVNQAAGEFVRKISPHYVTKEKYLMSGDDARIGIGNDLAEEGQFAQAASFWKEVLDQNPEAAAANNLGIHFEQLEENDRARELYMRALKLDPGASEPKDNLKTLSSFKKA